MEWILWKNVYRDSTEQKYILFIQIFISKNRDKIGKHDVNVKIENNESINCELFWDFLKCLLIITDARNLVVDWLKCEITPEKSSIFH